MDNSLIELIIASFLTGGIMTFFGCIIKFFNAGDMINLFDEKKHDKDKVSRYVGMDFLLTGLSVLILMVAAIFLNEKYIKLISYTQFFALLCGVAMICYHMVFVCKKELKDNK